MDQPAPAEMIGCAMSTHSPRLLVQQLERPIVQAPLGGGPSTPALAAAVAEAGGLGFLAAGYKTADAVRADLGEYRRRTTQPVAVNLFAPPGPPVDPAELDRYATTLRAEAARYGVAVGTPRHDDDGHDEKLGLLIDERVAIVSLTFGCPAREQIARLREAGIETWVTATMPEEAAVAADAVPTR
jgi:nitronate monooxygenase